MKQVSLILSRLAYMVRSPQMRAAMLLNALLFVALVGVGFLYWWPAKSARQDLQANIADTRRAVSLAMQANELADAYAKATRATEAVERKLQAPIGQAQLVQSFAGLARRHSVRIVSESYEEGKPQGGYVPLFLQVTLEGRYGSVRGFLNDIPSLPLWAEVEETRLERLREPAGLLKVQLRLRTVKRAPTGAGASPS